MAKEPRFTTQLYYGRVVISHYDQDTICAVGERLKTAVKQIEDELNIRLVIKTQWIEHIDGCETVDAIINAAGKWEKG